MKTITLLFTLFMATVASGTFAQMLPPQYSWQNIIHHRKPVPNSKNLLRGSSYQPLDEIDSSYNGNNTWAYDDNATYQYYLSNCMDSVETISVNKVPEERYLFGPYVNGNTTSLTIQVWEAGIWVNYFKEIFPSQATPCSNYYFFYCEWNSGTWDTIQGYKEIITTDSHGNPSVLSDSSLQVGEWRNTGTSYLFYDSNDTLRGMNYYQYGFSGAVDTIEIDTNFAWIPSLMTSSPYCNFITSQGTSQPLSYYEVLLADSASGWTYYKNEEWYYSHNPSSIYEIDWQWNGVGYDTVATGLTAYDSNNNDVLDKNESYDTVTHMLVVTAEDSSVLTYGKNGAMTRDEFWSFQCAPNKDSLYLCGVSVYSNFTNCSTAGIESIARESGNMLVYPNPASDNFTIVLPSQVMDARVEIFNAIGQLVKSINSFSDSKLNISTSDLSKGMYYVRVVSGATNNTAKIVIE